MSRQCPDDFSPLERHVIEGIEVDRCTECDGIFFDEGELAQFQDLGYQTMKRLESEGSPEGLVLIGVNQVRSCPACGYRMTQYRFQYSSAICLDGCEKCGGIWVQDGELGEIADYIRRHSGVEGRRVEVPSNAGHLASRELLHGGSTHSTHWAARLLGVFTR